MSKFGLSQICNGGGVSNGNNTETNGLVQDDPPTIKIEHYGSLSTKIVEEEEPCSSSPKESQEDDGGDAVMPEIGSKNSAFLPYKQQQSLTVLTNLQRGNVQTHMRDALPAPLTFHERAAKGELEKDEMIGEKVNSLDEHGLRALHWASYHGKAATAQMLVEKGAFVNAQATGGETALMFAATNGHLEVISFLLQHGATVDMSDEHGNTALMYATSGNHSTCVLELLKHGASLMRSNEFGDTPFGVAVSKNLHASQNAMEQYLKDLIEARSQHSS